MVQEGGRVHSCTIWPCRKASAALSIFKLADFHVKYYASSGTTDLTSINPIDVTNGVVFGESLFTHFFGDLAMKDVIEKTNRDYGTWVDELGINELK